MKPYVTFPFSNNLFSLLAAANLSPVRGYVVESPEERYEIVVVFDLPILTGASFAFENGINTMFSVSDVGEMMQYNIDNNGNLVSLGVLGNVVDNNLAQVYHLSRKSDVHGNT